MRTNDPTKKIESFNYVNLLIISLKKQIELID